MALTPRRPAARFRTRGRLLAVGRFALQAEKRQRATFDLEDVAAAAHLLRTFAERVAGVDQELPPEARPMRRQDERQRLVMRVEDNQDRVADESVAAIVELFDGVAREAQPEAARLGIVPVVLGHLLTVEPKPGQVLDLRAADLPALKKMAPAQHRLSAENVDQ